MVAAVHRAAAARQSRASAVERVCAFLAGYYLEPLIGRRWYAALFATGGLGGALASMLLNPPGVVTVGASGAIMGLLGAAVVLSFADAASEKTAKRMRWTALQMLIPSLIPMAAAGNAASTTPPIWAARRPAESMGLALQIIWPEGGERPVSCLDREHGSHAAGAVAAVIGHRLRRADLSRRTPADDGLIPDALMPAQERGRYGALRRSRRTLSARSARAILPRGLFPRANAISPTRRSICAPRCDEAAILANDTHAGTVRRSLRILSSPRPRWAKATSLEAQLLCRAPIATTPPRAPTWPRASRCCEGRHLPLIEGGPCPCSAPTRIARDGQF